MKKPYTFESPANATPAHSPFYSSFMRLPALRVLLILLMMVGISSYAWSTTVTHTFSATSGTIDPNISFACQQNSSATTPAFNVNLRLYYAASGAGCSITLTPSNGAVISEVKITGVTSYLPTVKYNVDGGADATASLSGSIYTVTGVSSSTSLKIRNANTTNTQLRITDIEVTYTIAGSTPTITLNPTTLAGFTYISGSGPSTEQTFTVSVTNMANDVSIAATTNYEISKTSGIGYDTPLVYTPTDLSTTQTVYVRLKAGLAVGNYNSEAITASSTGASNATVTCSGSVTAVINPEPTNHPTSFTATANSSSQITVTWTDATGSQLPAAYLVKAEIDPTTPGTPSDLTAEADGLLVKNIAQGIQTAVFTGLNASTKYNFSIWPYTNSGTAIDYKIGSEPTANATTTAPSVATYTWQGADNGSWAVSTNWNPTRTTPATSDILQFNDGTTKTVTELPTQTIGQLAVTNNTNINFQSTSAVTLTLGGGSGSDFTISSGSTLNLSSIVAANSVTLSLLTGATASISGNITLTGFTGGTAHRLLAADASSFTFNNGAVVTAGVLFTGNLFGNTLTQNVAIFSAGSTYVLVEGSNPFGFAAPSSKVVFQPGSLFRFVNSSNLSPSLSGRTYADVEINSTSSSLSSMSGTGAFTIDNLTITQGNCGFNLTNSNHSIKGNITVASGATFNFNPSAAGTINLNGTSPQTISGLGTISSGSSSTFAINNSAGVVLDANASLAGNLTVTAGSLTINPSRQLTVTGILTNTPGITGLIIKSNTTGTGSLIHNTADVPATIERYIAGSSTLTSMIYHQVSIPLTAASSPTSNLFLGSYLFSFNEAGGDGTTNQKGAWVALGEATNTPLNVDAGYLIYYPEASKTYTFAGNMRNGSVAPALTYADANHGFNLIPNPYPSAINWDAASGWSLSNVDDAIYVWNSSANTTNYGSYVGITTTNGVSNIIPSGQAFFVRANTASPTISMNNSVRVHDAKAFMKNSQAVNPDELHLFAASNGIQDEIAVRFAADVTSNFDGHADAYKMFGYTVTPQLNSVTPDGTKLSINSLPYSAGDAIVPLNFTLDAATEVTFTASGMESFQSSVPIYLEDMLINKIVNLREQPTYTFTHSGGAADQRFQLRFKGVNGTPQPNETLQGNVFVSGNKVNIDIPAMQQNTVQVSIFDALGRSFSQGKYTLNGILQLDAPTATGMYIVKVMSGNKVFTSKVIVK